MQAEAQVGSLAEHTSLKSCHLQLEQHNAGPATALAVQRESRVKVGLDLSDDFAASQLDNNISGCDTTT